MNDPKKAPHQEMPERRDEVQKNQARSQGPGDYWDFFIDDRPQPKNRAMSDTSGS